MSKVRQMGALIAASAAVLAGGCTIMRDSNPVSHPDAVRIRAHGLAFEILPSIDRATFFGESGGENLLHVVGLDRPVPPDGSYTFFGGCYTWVSPQKPGTTEQTALLGWIGPGGVKQDWPPDPAMDVGPVRRVAQTGRSITVTGPEQRTGLQEVKTFQILASDLAEVTCTLRNRGNDTVSGGCWTITAASPDDVLGVWMPEGAQVWGWDDASVEKFMSICSEPDARGWRMVDPSTAGWEGGIKVYITAPPVGPDQVTFGISEIAVWRRDAGAWLHRHLGILTPEQSARLRDAGEGPVAIYIEPREGEDAIIEAELYGPIEEIAPGESASVSELWRVIKSDEPNFNDLP